MTMNVSTIKSNDPCWCGSGKKFKRCHKDGGGASVIPEPSVVKGRVSPVRAVPSGIVRPDYVDNNGRPKRNNAAPIKSPDAIEKMRRACHAAVQVVEAVRPHVQVGVTTDYLDEITHQAYIDLGGYPSCVGYGGFLKSVCTSVNEVICHGIPDDRPLQNGDILNVDVTIFLDGYHGDYSVMFGVGDVDESSRQLIEVTKQCLDLGVAAVRPGAPINEVGRAIETHAKKFGYGVVHAFVGHGIGEVFHMAPNVPHYFDRNARTLMQPGMTFTIEPMITLSGRFDYDLWDDGWTAVTTDLSRTAQWEHTVLVTETGVEILTQ
jgi:methionyl aminopeptidase